MQDYSLYAVQLEKNNLAKDQSDVSQIFYITSL